jgi:ubiquinone/menaquinone biosynthesis C-methylase UbiE
VDLHLETESYDLGPLRSGLGELTPIEEREIGDVGGLHILHLQCHFGRDTLTLAQRGATVVGLDFSPRAISVARGLADELGLSDRARFIEADVYDAPEVLDERFDLVFVNWGALFWLPDIRR